MKAKCNGTAAVVRWRLNQNLQQVQSAETRALSPCRILMRHQLAIKLIRYVPIEARKTGESGGSEGSRVGKDARKATTAKHPPYLRLGVADSMEEDALVSMMENCSEPQVQLMHDGLKVEHFKLQRELTGRLS
jgi:hypothetical protein